MGERTRYVKHIDGVGEIRATLTGDADENNEGKRRDELLRQIGERVVERASADGFIYAGPQTAIPKCPACGVEGANPFHPFHANDCPLTRYLEATDE